MAVKFDGVKDVIKANREFLELFDPAQRDKFFKLNMLDVLDWWRFVYLRRRIEADSVRKSPFNYKEGRGGSPLVWTGRLIKKVGKGKITVSKPRGGSGFIPFAAQVSLPFGHPVRPAISKIFRVGAGGFLADEIRSIALKLADNITQEAKGIRKVNRKNKSTGVKTPVYSLSKKQKERLKAPIVTRTLDLQSRKIFDRG